jgi:tRNA threonylcarbamoyladenosine biosynthesis protein TsaE
METERGDGRRPLRVLVSHSPEATEALGEALGRLARPGLLLTLDGDLGAGKTCFVRGLARGLEVLEPVSSPTFALMNEYEGRLPLLHCDAWMEGRERAFLADGGVERLSGGAVGVVEWGERVADQLPGPHLFVRLAHRGGGELASTRRCELGVSAPDAALEALLGGLELPPGLEEESPSGPRVP